MKRVVFVCVSKIPTAAKWLKPSRDGWWSRAQHCRLKTLGQSESQSNRGDAANWVTTCPVTTRNRSPICRPENMTLR